MMSRTVRIRLDNGAYPCLIAHWIEDDDHLGWHAKTSVWNADKEKENCEHTISLRQSTPLGFISVYFDSCHGGTWRAADFEGTTLTERDLVWATCWAAQAMESKHLSFPHDTTQVHKH